MSQSFWKRANFVAFILAAAVLIVYWVSSAQKGFDYENTPADLYASGIEAVLARDYAAAASLFERASSAGYSEAQYELGLLYFEGKGVRQSEKKAARWYRKAAEQGHADAQYRLASMYMPKDCGGSYLNAICEMTRQVPLDKSEAIEWNQLAADQGHVSAQYNLGHMHYKGWGTPKDDTKALMWWMLSAAKGHKGAIQNTDLLMKQMTWEEVSKAEHLAEDWLQTHPPQSTH